MKNKKKNNFEYTYLAPTNEERKEIESIRNSYIEKSKSASDGKLGRLRKLDYKVKEIPVIVALAVGIFGMLIFGLGMTMILEWKIYVWGIIVCLVGFVPMILAYPINNRMMEYLKNKYSEEILKLSEELLNEDGKQL